MTAAPSPAQRLKALLRGLRAPRRPSALALQVREEGLTYLSEQKLMRLEDALRDIAKNAVPGSIVEFGVALGGSSVVLARAAAAQARAFHGFDVFGMIPEPTSEKDDAHSKERYKVIASGEAKGLNGAEYYGYIDDLFDRVADTLARYGTPVAPGAVVLHKGLFEDTLPGADIAPVAFAHIDCDWYDPVKLCLAELADRMSPGGTILLDDYHAYGGCREAVDEFLAADDRFSMEKGANPILRKRA